MEPLNDRTVITFYNLDGRKVQSTLLEHGQSQVDISALCPGIYMITREASGQAPLRARMVKTE
jgi:hypothetical protein